MPDATIQYVERKYRKLRKSLPQENGEVKGRRLDEAQLTQVVDLLVASDVLFEISATDLGLHAPGVIEAVKAEHARYTQDSVPRFNLETRPRVEEAARQIAASSPQLYAQALTTFEVLHRTIGHATVYYVQRNPRELGSFVWTVDGKDPTKVTNWEKWWAGYAQGALSTMSINRPSPIIPGADYSHYDKFNITNPDGVSGTDISKVLGRVRFSSDSEPGLELVDILTNATRRALVGNLAEAGMKQISRIMVHRDEEYIQFLLFGSNEKSEFKQINTSYASRVRVISRGGKPMLTANWIKHNKDSE